jgi:hypothetical protein
MTYVVSDYSIFNSYQVAIINLPGATILPVWPTCKELSTKPASTAAREAPTEFQK